MGNLYLGDTRIETNSMYLGDKALFSGPVFIDDDGKEYWEEDCHIFIGSSSAVAFPIPNGTEPLFVSVDGVQKDYLTEVSGQSFPGAKIMAIFDWDNKNYKWQQWFSEILNIGLNSETNKRNQLKNGFVAFKKMKVQDSEILKNLDVSNLTNMSQMFIESDINTDISQWNTAKAQNMDLMFKDATKFNQDLSEWCVSEIVSYVDFDTGATAWTNSRPVWGTCPRGENVPNIDDILPDPYVTKDCHVFEANGNSVNLPCVGSPTFVAVNGVAQPITLTTRTIEVPEIGVDGIATTTSQEVQTAAISAKDGDIIHAIFDWDGNGGENNWFSDILQFGSRSPGGEPEGYVNPTPLASGRIPNQLKDAAFTFYKMEVSPAALSTLDTSNLTDMTAMFIEAKSFNSDISSWDVSNVVNMNAMFSKTQAFNQDISGWDVSNVTDMTTVFDNAIGFDQPIGNWDTSKVTIMFGMFKDATRFNQDLSEWCVSNVTDYPFFDTGATAWTLPNSRPIWGTCPRGENIELPDDYTFKDCHVFVANGNAVILPCTGLPIFVAVNGVDVTPTTLTTRTIEFPDFENRTADNEISTTTKEIQTTAISANDGDIIHAIFDWVPNIEKDWFSDILQFGSRSTGGEPEGYVNPPLLPSGRVPNQLKLGMLAFGYMEQANPAAISTLDVSNVTDMAGMFFKAYYFNSDISGWDISNVTTMENMFYEASIFNSDISGWDTSKVENMTFMLCRTIDFDQPIGNWNTSKVTTMFGIFQMANSFNQDISGWDTSKVEDMDYIFFRAPAFNQNLSQWCVRKISFKPEYFNLDSGFDGQTDKEPQWGTCPRGEDKG